MTHNRITGLERDMDDIHFEEFKIKKDLENIKKELIDKTPDHFSKRDWLRSFMGSLFLGFSVLFSSKLLDTASSLPPQHIYVIALFTLIVLSSEIYFVGYSRVDNKNERKFGQFWFKRMIAFLIVSFCVSLILVYIFGVIYVMDSTRQLWNTLIILSAICAVGASVGDLIKRY